MKKKVLVFSADPGGAECLLPVLNILPKAFTCSVMAKSDAEGVFKRHTRSIVNVDNISFGDMEHMVSAEKIDLVLTSASSFPERDMFEKFLWRWADKAGIPSVAVLDQWQNYSARFSGTSAKERLAYLPTKICIMDNFARKEMLAEGFPTERLCITGQPAIESFGKEVAVLKSHPLDGFLSDADKESIIFTFFSQPINAFFGNSLGYTEASILDDIAAIIPNLQEAADKRILLICKLHPRNKKSDFGLNGSVGRINVKFVSGEYSNHELVATSNIIFGVGSVMLVHSILAEVPTVYYCPVRENSLNDCMPVRIGAIPRVTGRKELKTLVTKVIADKNFRRQYLRQQRICRGHSGASLNIISVMDRLVKKERRQNN